MHYGHGGDITGFEQQYGSKPLDFSANTNPLGISPLARQAVISALDGADCYPDPHCRRLRAALSEHEGVDSGRIVCGNGAADLIFRIVQAAKPKKALLTAPTFSEYGQALAMHGCSIKLHHLQHSENFALTEAILKDISPSVDMLFLCEPNNPTGVASDPALLERIVERCAQTGTALVVDECFNGFLADAAKRSCKRWLDDLPGLIILKAFTKLYGMAGLRLGYALCGSKETAAAIWGAGPPWMVSTLAQAAGIAALGDMEYVRRTLEMVASERPRMQQELARLGLEVFPSMANYLLLHTQREGLQQKLAKRGIMIRNCSNYAGLGEGYYRIAVRTPEQNDILLSAMEEALILIRN